LKGWICPRWAVDDSGLLAWASNLRGALRRILHPMRQATVFRRHKETGNSDRPQPPSPAAPLERTAGGAAPAPRFPCFPSPRPPQASADPAALFWIAWSACLSWPAVWASGKRHAPSSKRDLPPLHRLPSAHLCRGFVTSTGELEAVRSVNVSPSVAVSGKAYVVEGQAVAARSAIALMDSGDSSGPRERAQGPACARLRRSTPRSRSEYETAAHLFEPVRSKPGRFPLLRHPPAHQQGRLDAARQRSSQRKRGARRADDPRPFDGVITQRFADPGGFRAPHHAPPRPSRHLEFSWWAGQGLEAGASVPEKVIIGRVFLVRGPMCG